MPLHYLKQSLIRFLLFKSNFPNKNKIFSFWKVKIRNQLITKSTFREKILTQKAGYVKTKKSFEGFPCRLHF